MRMDSSQTRLLQRFHQHLWLIRKGWKYSGSKNGCKSGSNIAATRDCANNQSEF